MKSTSRFSKVFVLVYAVFFIVLYFPPILGIDSGGPFAHMQYLWQDFLFQRNGSALKEGNPRLILVAIDDETGKEHGFPLPRAVYAQALDKLKNLGVKTVIFDVLFFEKREAAGDSALAEATKRFGRVVHLFHVNVQSTEHGDLSSASLPIPPLLKSTKFFGHPDITDLLDADGHMRRFAFFRSGVQDPLRPELYAASLEAATLSADGDITLQNVFLKFGDATRYLNFRQPKSWQTHEKSGKDEPKITPHTVYSPYRSVSLLDVLSGKLSQDQKTALKNSIVILGSTALGYYDHYPTPFIESAPGAEFHLNAIDNAISNDFLGAWSHGRIMLFILLAIGLTFFLQRFSPAIGAALTASTLIAWLLFCFSKFRHGIIVEFIPPAAALVSAYLVLVVHRVMAEGREKREIKNLFGQFVAPEVVDHLAQDPSKVKLGGEKRDMTVFFLDIAHFTNISEKMDPEALIQFLNKYLSSLSQVIFDHNGTIDKYIGDCIMAFWNAPIENKNHRADAILAALDCQKAINELNKSLDPNLPEVPAVRIGINSGIVTVGLTGSQKKLQYTVIGDDVNLASRLEGANKFFGSKTIVSESTFDEAKDQIIARVLGRVRVVGKETPIKIFEPLAGKGKLNEDWQKALPLYEEGISAFDNRQYDKALAAFEKFLTIFPKDGPGQLYLARCQEYAVIAPDASWDGVFNLTAK